jgi:transcription initiation factor TFIIIB Brf1 subunit/transcription initiation factor TFIIB
MALFENAELGLPCPGCGGKSPKTIAWIKANTEFVCDHCGATVQMDKADLEKGLGEVDSALEEIKRNLRR